MSENITAARKEFDGHDQNWQESRRKQEGFYAGFMAQSAMCRADEVAADVAALTKRVGEIQDSEMAEVFKRLNHLEHWKDRSDAEEPDVDDIRVVGVFRETAIDPVLLAIAEVFSKELCSVGGGYDREHNAYHRHGRCQGARLAFDAVFVLLYPGKPIQKVEDYGREAR